MSINDVRLRAPAPSLLTVVVALLHGAALAACPDVDLGSPALPASISGSTSGSCVPPTPGCYGGSCGGSLVDQRSYRFIAPFTGVYTFHTNDPATNFTTALYVRDSCASGGDLECASPLSGLTEVTLGINAGQQVIIFVDGYLSSDDGNFVLHIDFAYSCPATDLGSTVPQTYVGSTAGLKPAYTSACGGGKGPETGLAFTAPTDGLYTFDTVHPSTNYDSILHARDGACGDAVQPAPSLACNNDIDTTTTASRITLPLTQGQTIVVFVDGRNQSGDFGLNVGQFCDPTATALTKVEPTKLIVVDKMQAADKAKVVFVAKDPAITKGTGADVTTIGVDFTAAYANGSAAGGFVLPVGDAGWLANKSSVAKFVNKSAPSGSTEAKVAVIKPGKLLKLVGKGLGDTNLDIRGAGDPVGPVRTAYCVSNDGDKICHCSTFTGCVHKPIAAGTGAKLVCKTGAGDAACTAICP